MNKTVAINKYSNQVVFGNQLIFQVIDVSQNWLKVAIKSDPQKSKSIMQSCAGATVYMHAKPI